MFYKKKDYKKVEKTNLTTKKKFRKNHSENKNPECM